MSFLAKNLKNIGTPAKGALPKMEGVPFGAIFAPHMFECDWAAKSGWGTPTIKDFGPLTIPAQCGGLHYGLQCFEGLKAYRDAKGTVRLFRPDMNARRLKRSMTRLCFPDFEEKEFLECLKQLVLQDKDWIPTDHGYSLYIRPTAIGTNDNLRVGPADKCKLYIITSPVGPYYPEGFKPVKLVADSKHKRAWPGGTGDYKLGANYAGPIQHQVAYAKEGYSQILWLGPKGEVDEVGAMNFMCLWKNKQGERELITAPLDGTILPGVTRDSILQMTRGWGEFKVTEGRFNIDELVEALRENRVEELFGCGTAAIVTAVEALKYEDKVYKVPFSEKSVTVRILKELQDIQEGRKAHEWSWVLN